MDRREAEQTLRQINAHHFEANPSPVSEQWLAYSRDERDKLIHHLAHHGYKVEVQHGDSLEACGRYRLGEGKYPIVQEDGIRSLCATCGKLYSYRMVAVGDDSIQPFIDALHQHLDFCRCWDKEVRV